MQLVFGNSYFLFSLKRALVWAASLGLFFFVDGAPSSLFWVPLHMGQKGTDNQAAASIEGKNGLLER